MKRRLSPLQVGIWLFAAACHLGRSEKASPPVPQREFWYSPDSICADSSPRWLPPVRATDTITVPDVHRTDQQWAIWARRTPGGWAGGPHYLASVPGPPTILLRDTTQKAAALVVLDSILTSRLVGPFTTNERILARQARWDLAELYDWQAYIVSNFRIAKGTTINSWGISNQKNAIRIGVEKRETLLATMNWLHDINVPCRLVIVEVIGKIYAGGMVHQIQVRKTPQPKRSRRQ